MQVGLNVNIQYLQAVFFLESSGFWLPRPHHFLQRIPDAISSLGRRILITAHANNRMQLPHQPGMLRCRHPGWNASRFPIHPCLPGFPKGRNSRGSLGSRCRDSHTNPVCAVGNLPKECLQGHSGSLCRSGQESSPFGGVHFIGGKGKKRELDWMTLRN